MKVARSLLILLGLLLWLPAGALAATVAELTARAEAGSIEDVNRRTGESATGRIAETAGGKLPAEPSTPPLAQPPESAPAESAVKPADIAVGKKAYVRQDTVLVRKEASGSSPFIVKVSQGTKVVAVKIQGDWVLVEVEGTGKSGWILSSSLTSEKIESPKRKGGEGVKGKSPR